MTGKRLANLDAPSVPLPPPPTRVQLARDLVRLAVGMERVAVDMEYLGGFGELAAKGRELRETALIARGWARHDDRERMGMMTTERQSMGEWKPIETAPLHEDCLFFRDDCGVFLGQKTHLADWFLDDSEQEEYPEEVLFQVDVWWYGPRGVSRQEGDCVPTHWMPLPPPPATQRTGEESIVAQMGATETARHDDRERMGMMGSTERREMTTERQSMGGGASFRVYDKVRVKPGVEPTHGWGWVNPGDIGTVRRLPIGQDPMKVAFGGRDREWWSAIPDEMELEPPATQRTGEG